MKSKCSTYLRNKSQVRAKLGNNDKKNFYKKQIDGNNHITFIVILFKA